RWTNQGRRGRQTDDEQSGVRRLRASMLETLLMLAPGFQTRPLFESACAWPLSRLRSVPDLIRRPAHPRASLSAAPALRVGPLEFSLAAIGGAEQPSEQTERMLGVGDSVGCAKRCCARSTHRPRYFTARPRSARDGIRWL